MRSSEDLDWEEATASHKGLREISLISLDIRPDRKSIRVRVDEYVI